MQRRVWQLRAEIYAALAALAVNGNG